MTEWIEDFEGFWYIVVSKNNNDQKKILGKITICNEEHKWEPYVIDLKYGWKDLGSFNEDELDIAKSAVEKALKTNSYI